MTRVISPVVAGVLDAIGHTPVICSDGVWVKLECANPGGSIKDRIALFMLRQAARRGELRPGDTVVEATSGNTGIAIAMVARELGYPVMIWMPEHMSRERREILAALGADVRLTPEADGFAGPIARRDAYRGRLGYFVPDQFANPDNARCHYETTGRELVTQLVGAGCRRLDAFVAGVGTGGTLMGVGRALREVIPEIRRVGVEPAESAVMSGGAPGPHGIQGIGDGFVPDLLDMDEVDEVIQVSTAEAEAQAHRIHRWHGYCVGMSSGANMSAALRLRDRGLAVATVWPDCSDRYMSMGLEAPSLDRGSCPLRAACASRWALLDAEPVGSIEVGGRKRDFRSEGASPIHV